MSDQPQTNDEPAAGDRLDENISRLLSTPSHSPTLVDVAESRMLVALKTKQAELYADKEAPMQPVKTRNTSAYNGKIVVGLAALACSVLVAFIYGPRLFQNGNADSSELGALEHMPQHRPMAIGDLTRQQLPDGTILIANTDTDFEIQGNRQVKLLRGELYLIVAKSEQPFFVKTSHGEVRATGTRFQVSTGDSTSAAVAQGRVTLAGDKGKVELRAGQQGTLREGERPTRRPAPRVSHLVSWAKKALAQGELLVKKNESENGLVAVDPTGQETHLTLRKYHVDVHIEDGIARTTIDQTFFNHYPWNTEGTFYFPLPPDASVSRLAMYVAGRLNEGGMVERGRGQQIYNDIRYQQRDPALLEMMEGNVFKMRIFPLEGRQEKRILLSYTQNLDELYASLRYWFPMDHTNSVAGELSIRVHVKDGAKSYNPQSSTHQLEAATDGDDLILTYNAKNERPDQDLLLHLVPSTAPPAMRVTTCEKDGHKFAFARFSPEIPGTIEPESRQWIVVNDISASRSKIGVQAQRYILGRLIEEADDDDTLFLINLNTRAHLLSKTFTAIRSKETRNLLKKTPAPRLGATDLFAGMQAAAEVIREHKVANPHILYLGDGVATYGSMGATEPVKAIPSGATFVGVGVGKKVNSLFLQDAADRTGGMFTTINPDEDIDWRVFDLLAALNTPRLTSIEISLQDASGKPMTAQAYPNSRSLSHGETLTVVARCKSELPAKIVLKGQVGEKPYHLTADVAKKSTHSQYIPRLWAKRHIDELLKANDHEKEIIELSKQYYVVTPLTSLIVLEDEKMYKEYNVERGRKDHWALYPALKKIEVVKEPVDWSKWGWYYGGRVGEDEKIKAKAKPKSVRDIVDSVQFRVNAPFYYWNPQRYGQGRFSLYQLADTEVDPTRLLTYWFLVAGGDRELAARLQREHSDPSSSDAASRKLHKGGPGKSNILRKGDYMAYAYFNLVGNRANVDSIDSRLIPAMASEMLPMPNMSNFTFPFQPMRLPKTGEVILRRAQMMGYLLDDRERRLQSMFVAGLSLADNGRIVDDLQPDLLRSTQTELRRRRLRINRDIRDFNRQFGHWAGYDNWNGFNSIDLSRSTNIRLYGGLEGLLVSQEGRQILPPSVILPPNRNGQMPVSNLFGPPIDGQDAAGGRGGKLGKSPVAWLDVYGDSLSSQPGTCSVLAADYLVRRKKELSSQEPASETKRELDAIAKALGNVDVAANRLEDSGRFWGHQGWTYRPQPWSFQPPTVQVYHGYNWSFDVTRYVPALYSSSFDILNEVSQQFPSKSKGKVSDAARERIKAARKAIKPVKLRFEKDGQQVLVASGDRFAMTRRTEMYLEEQMICDGEQILHLYDEIGLAARRPATALRMTSMRQLAPHLIEPADSLAKRFNVTLARHDESGFTLRLTSLVQADNAKEPVVMFITATDDGRILETIITVAEETRLKLTYEYTEGEIEASWSDKDGKDLGQLKYFAEPLADMLVFTAGLADYVVFDMPLRKPSYYAKRLETAGDDDLREKIRLKRHQALAHMQQLQGRRWGQANAVAKQALTEVLTLQKQAKRKVKIGDLTLFGSAGVHQATVEFKKISSIDETHPVFRFYRMRNVGWVDAQAKFKDHINGLLGHLACYHACAQQQRPSEHFDFFAKSFSDSPLLLAAAYYTANWNSRPEAWAKLYEHPRWRSLAMMMSAQHLKKPEHQTQLAKAFEKFYDELSDSEYDPPVTPSIVSILKSHESGKLWQKIVAEKFQRAKKFDRVGSLLHFAESAMSWGESQLADESLKLARERLLKQNSLRGRLALAQAYWACNRLDESLKLYDDILDRLKANKIVASPSLLASMARLSQQAGNAGLAIDLEEQALAAEHPHLPELINLQAFRQRYNWLWQQYQAKVTEAVNNKDDEATQDWLARAEATWQRWHEIDPENTTMISQMATLQMAADRIDKAWLYLSTIIDQRPRDAQSYSFVSQWYRSRKELDVAEVWLGKAYRWDTANPRWLWEHGQLLDQLGRHDQAREAYQRIVDGQWAAGLQNYVQQAKAALQK